MSVVQTQPECVVCGRAGPVCEECKRCGDSDCNSGCIWCVKSSGPWWKALIPRRVPQEDRLVPR